MKRRLLPAVLVLLLFMPADVFAMLHPVQSRFLQRDPAGYAEGMNGYEVNGGDPCGNTDSSGLYSSHTKIEEGAIDVGLPGRLINDECRKVIVYTMVTANNGQDKGKGDKTENLFYHYLRPYKDKGNGGRPGKVQDWDAKWKAYVDVQADEFWKELELAEKQQADKRWSHCEKALQAQARRDHALQDFFAHAVPDKKDDPPPYGRDPREEEGRKGYHPASYDQPRLLNPFTWDPRRAPADEHNTWDELSEAQRAVADAKRVTEKELTSALRPWERLCHCSCNLQKAPSEE